MNIPKRKLKTPSLSLSLVSLFYARPVPDCLYLLSAQSVLSSVRTTQGAASPGLLVSTQRAASSRMKIGK